MVFARILVVAIVVMLLNMSNAAATCSQCAQKIVLAKDDWRCFFDTLDWYLAQSTDPVFVPLPLNCKEQNAKLKSGIESGKVQFYTVGHGSDQQQVAQTNTDEQPQYVAYWDSLDDTNREKVLEALKGEPSQPLIVQTSRRPDALLKWDTISRVLKQKILKQLAENLVLDTMGTGKEVAVLGYDSMVEVVSSDPIIPTMEDGDPINDDPRSYGRILTER